MPAEEIGRLVEGAAAADVVTADVRVHGEGFDEHHHKEQVLRVAPGQVEGLPVE